MKSIVFYFILFQSIWMHSQDMELVVDTTSSLVCKENLYKDYKKKFELLNDQATYENSHEKKIIKEITAKGQTGFLETIAQNEFLCDGSLLTYMQKLMGEVLTSNALDVSKFRILVSKDAAINAYNLGEGTIVVNFGLFLALESEDDLIFVLAHEIGHQYLQHINHEVAQFAKIATSKEIVSKTKEIEKQKYKKAASANDLLKNITYQSYASRRRQEIEADSLGLSFYRKTTRNPTAAIKVLEQLDRSDEEKDSLTVADYKSIFNKSGFTVKDKYFQDEASLFTRYEVEKRINTDSLKTHPACSVRIDLLKKYLGTVNEDNRFTQSQQFENLKKHSIYQNLIHLYTEKSYGASLYEALKIYKYNGTDLHLRKLICDNLLQISKAKSNYTINRYVASVDNKYNTDSQNRFIRFINNLRSSEIELLITQFKQ